MVRHVLVLLAAGSVGCFGGDRERGGGGAGTPITVEVRDRAGAPVAGIDVVSSFDGTFVDVARTGADGKAEIGVEDGGELTALRRDGYHIAMTTVAGVADDRSQVIPIERLDDAAPIATIPLAVTVTTAGLAGTGRVDAGGCESFDAIPGTVAVEVHPDCVQSDGTVSLTALSLGPGLQETRGVGILVDVALDARMPAVLVAPTSLLVAISVPLSISGPAAGGARWAATGVRKGRRVGPAPEGVFAVSSTARLFGVAGAATGVRVAAMEEMYPFSGSLEMRQRASLEAVAFDSAAWLAPGTGILVEEGGRLYVEITDPGPQAMFTEIQLYWNDGDVVSHNWFIVAPPPAAAGTRRIPVPEMPPSLADMVLDLDTETAFVFDYVEADWIDDYREDPLLLFTVPESEWTLVRTRTWF